ncbi:hypothetical protein ElyMa_006173300 [Elysia marginata]|uniref:Uncharacterized protein n=1 Tax=Elysia marginata TaxID=1093978 RepID=A0AAV4H1K7_9GAST|nr:hypothetical protein ElyMa_006173300 [Elysia marginata]
MSLSCLNSQVSFSRRSGWPGFNFEIFPYNGPKLRWVTGFVSAWGPFLGLVNYLASLHYTSIQRLHCPVLKGKASGHNMVKRAPAIMGLKTSRHKRCERWRPQSAGISRG